MATPTSSATSDSPPMAYLQPGPAASANMTDGDDAAELELRNKAIQKFLARAEISMITRGLRTRLSYASYKATHNVPHVTLRDLEARSISQTASHRTAGAKRKAGGANAYYNPSVSGSQNNVSSPSAPSASRRGGMPPPSVSASASRVSHPDSPPAGSALHRSANAAQSLYASILAPPPHKQARTIHDVNDPIMRTPERSAPTSPRGLSTPGTRRSLVEGTRSQTKSRRQARVTGTKDKHAGKGKGKGASQNVIATGEEADIKAAAALTSLLLHSRPSITGSAGSPRSSMSAGSDPGSTNSFSHFSQSSIGYRTIPSTTASNDGSSLIPNNGASTPPPSKMRPTSAQTTPKASAGLRGQVGDTEAADLMLFLATSPSPARPDTNRDRDVKDSAAFRTLSGGPGLRAKGRVLFPTSADAGSSSNLAHGGDASFNSSLSSISGQMGSANDATMESESTDQGSHTRDDERNLDRVDVPPIASNLPLSHLLPPLPPSPPAQGTPSPSGTSFNFNDFINVSPSPAHIDRSATHQGALRPDLSRRLFEEEEQRHPRASAGGVTGSGVTMGLGAGIDLVQS